MLARGKGRWGEAWVEVGKGVGYEEICNSVNNKKKENSFSKIWATSIPYITLHTLLIFTRVHFIMPFETEEGRETSMREREASIGCLPHVPGLRIIHAPTGGWNLQPKYGTWPGIASATFQLWDNTPTNWTTPARGCRLFIRKMLLESFCSTPAGIVVPTVPKQTRCLPKWPV